MGSSWTGHGSRAQGHLIDHCIFIRDRHSPNHSPHLHREPGAGMIGEARPGVWGILVKEGKVAQRTDGRSGGRIGFWT